MCVSVYTKEIISGKSVLGAFFTIVLGAFFFSGNSVLGAFSPPLHTRTKDVEFSRSWFSELV